MKSPSKAVILAILVALVAAATASAYAADTTWDKHYPRRDQVNDRLARQKQRIKEEVREGDLSKAQAASLHKEDRQIRKEERLMATSQNGGHITMGEQKVLNRQENAMSRQIAQ